MSTMRACLALCATMLAGATVLPMTATAETPPPLPPAPTEGCVTFDDPAGDATAYNLRNGLPPGPDDPDLDLVGVVLASPPDKLRAYLQVTKLGAPAYGVGHFFVASAMHKGKLLEFFAVQDHAAVEGAHQSAATFGLAQRMSGVKYDGGVVADAVTEAVFDVDRSTVILTTDRAPIEKATGTSLSDGTILSKPGAQSANDLILTNLFADTAEGAEDFEVGSDPCFGQGPPSISLSAPSEAVAGHTVEVSGLLANDAGKASAHERVTITAGDLAVEAFTDEDGAFSRPFPLRMRAGSYEFTATFVSAGAPDVRTSLPLVVTVQPTISTLTAQPTGDRTLLTFRLVDDLQQPLANKEVSWSVDGRPAGTTVTGADGRTTFTSPPKHTIRASYAGERERYAPSRAAKAV